MSRHRRSSACNMHRRRRRLDRRSPGQVLFFVLLVLAAFIYFAPVWVELPISAAAGNRRLFSTMWR